MYQRIGDKGLYDFFAVNFDFVKHLIDVGIKEVAPCAWPWRIVVLKNVNFVYFFLF